jgi:hypothetical protein
MRDQTAAVKQTLLSHNLNFCHTHKMDSEGDSQDPFSMSVGEMILRKYNYHCSICLNLLTVAGSECVDVFDSASG